MKGAVDQVQSDGLEICDEDESDTERKAH
jgi:hypothetical protein